MRHFDKAHPFTPVVFLHKLYSKYTVPATNPIGFPQLVLNVFRPHTPINKEFVMILALWQHWDLDQPHAIFDRLHF